MPVLKISTLRGHCCPKTAMQAACILRAPPQLSHGALACGGRCVRRGQRLRLQPLRAQPRGGLGDEDVDVAVFRFTLGIPGFDDRLVPLVVGTVLGGLLILNHVFGAQPAPGAQVRSESLGAVLAVLCFMVPEIEERLREAMPGRGRQKTADAVAGAANSFLLDSSLPDASKKELAWGSFALLKNTNACGVILWSDGKARMARGFVGSSAVQPGNAEASLAALSQDAARVQGSAQLAAVASGSTDQAWLPERSDFGGAGAQCLAGVPAGAQCLVVQHVPVPGGKPALLAVYSERPRALSDRERSWVAAIASKFGPFLA